MSLVAYGEHHVSCAEEGAPPRITDAGTRKRPGTFGVAAPHVVALCRQFANGVVGDPGYVFDDQYTQLRHAAMVNGVRRSREGLMALIARSSGPV
jgi:hypothetical protein